VLTLVFLLTYGGSNWLATIRPTRFHIYSKWELAIPFLPWMIWAYLSLQVFFALPLFVLDSAGISRFGETLLIATLAAAVMHLIFPADLGWVRPAVVPGYPVFARFFVLDRPHNLVPSLHVSYSALTCMVSWNATERPWIRLVASLWLALLVCSVSLVHQHHLADIASGLALAAICYRWFKGGSRESGAGRMP
jgi:hypothetical protein